MCACVFGLRADSFDVEFEAICILNFPKGNFVPDLATGNEYHGAISSHAHRKIKAEQKERGGPLLAWCILDGGWDRGRRDLRGIFGGGWGLTYLRLSMGGCWLLASKIKSPLSKQTSAWV